MARVTLRLDQAKVRTVVGGQTHRAAQQAARVAQRRAQANAPKDTGALARSIEVVDRTRDPMRPVLSVGSDLEYAIHQEKGTRGSQARPGGVLVFRPKGSAVVIFRPRTGPVPATRFMQRAVESLTAGDWSV